MFFGFMLVGDVHKPRTRGEGERGSLYDGSKLRNLSLDWQRVASSALFIRLQFQSIDTEWLVPRSGNAVGASQPRAKGKKESAITFCCFLFSCAHRRCNSTCTLNMVLCVWSMVFKIIPWLFCCGAFVLIFNLQGRIKWCCWPESSETR